MLLMDCYFRLGATKFNLFIRDGVFFYDSSQTENFSMKLTVLTTNKTIWKIFLLCLPNVTNATQSYTYSCWSIHTIRFFHGRIINFVWMDPGLIMWRILVFPLNLKFWIFESTSEIYTSLDFFNNVTMRMYSIDKSYLVFTMMLALWTVCVAIIIHENFIHITLAVEFQKNPADRMATEYVGKMFDGQMHGVGKLTYENDENYHGDFVRGNAECTLYS